MRLRGADLKTRIDAGRDRRYRPPSSNLPLVDCRRLAQIGPPGLVRRSGAGAGRRVHRRGHLLDRFLPVADRERGRAGRGQDGEPRPQRHRGRRLGMATFTFANGVIATLEASWTINAPRKTARRRNRTASCGSESSARAARSSISGFARRGWPCSRPAPQDWVFERQSRESVRTAAPFPLDHLIDCLENKGPLVASTIRDARSPFVAAMAAYDPRDWGRPSASVSVERHRPSRASANSHDRLYYDEATGSERLKALNRFGLGVERFEQRHKTRNGEQVMIPRGDVQQLQRPTRLHDRAVGSHQLAKATAVDVRHVLEIQDDVGTLLRDETVDLVFEMLRALIAWSACRRYRVPSRARWLSLRS